MVTVGTCGLCGGPVQVPESWGGRVPAPKKCAHCGATAKPNFGPVLPMQPRPERKLDCVATDGCKVSFETLTPNAGNNRRSPQGERPVD